MHHVDELDRVYQQYFQVVQFQLVMVGLVEVAVEQFVDMCRGYDVLVE